MSMAGAPQTGTDQVIARLMRDAPPVRRLRPPFLRACLWLAAFAAVSTAGIMLFADMAVFHHRMVTFEMQIELFGTLATGLLAVIAAFELSMPDRSHRWALLPFPALAVWLAGSGAGCYRSWLVSRDGMWALGDTWHCFGFVMGFGLPISLALLWALRAARPVSPFPVALMGGVGAAALAAFLLQFFHPFDVTFMDLSVHALAVLVLVCAVTWRGRPALG